MTQPSATRGALRMGLAGMAAMLLFSVPVKMFPQQGNAVSGGTVWGDLEQRQFLDHYCVGCHNDRAKTGELSLEQVDVSKPDSQPELWEKVVRELHTGVVPPPTCRSLLMLTGRAAGGFSTTWLERR